jgi:riboflavin transporter FmnP
MPIYPGGAKYGLGLWNSVPATMIVEGIMFAAGLWIYVQTTRARDWIGRWGFAALIALLVVVYAANATASPPPSVNAIIIGATIGVVIMTVWSWWVDDCRDFVGIRD